MVDVVAASAGFVSGERGMLVEFDRSSGDENCEKEHGSPLGLVFAIMKK